MYMHTCIYMQQMYIARRKYAAMLAPWVAAPTPGRRRRCSATIRYGGTIDGQVAEQSLLILLLQQLQLAPARRADILLDALTTNLDRSTEMVRESEGGREGGRERGTPRDRLRRVSLASMCCAERLGTSDPPA